MNMTVQYETMEYETVVCSEMPMFPDKMVSIALSMLQPSKNDLVMNELPAVEDLSATVGTLCIALQCYRVRPDFIGHILQLQSAEILLKLESRKWKVCFIQI